ncbi:uncharacterized protein LOC130425648 [Triplophysa dalaica]|uniref:uncharacterized protein LOC130425648 n=1 Tax=Triplophysa dalaica TaxID=1582913 RepID=UPI0024DFC15B|nr:uncharacterized protein LOC130425648 [Triplophysa dalaica]
MRACLFLGFLLKQIFDLSASQDFQYIERLEGESLDIVFTAQQRNSRPSLLYLRSFAHSEVLNISENIDKKPDIDGRIRISAYLNSGTVNVTLSNLKYKDTGLYVCEFLSENQHAQTLANRNILLLVKVAGELRSCDRHSWVIYIVSILTYLLLLAAIAFTVVHYKKLHKRQESQHSIPIYEDMARNSNTADLHQVPETAVPDWTNNNQNMLENYYSSPQSKE